MKRILRRWSRLLLAIGLLLGLEACASSGGGWTDDEGDDKISIHVSVRHRHGYGPGWGSGWYRPPVRPPRPPGGPTIQPIGPPGRPR